jgi:hypothetical protein
MTDGASRGAALIRWLVLSLAAAMTGTFAASAGAVTLGNLYETDQPVPNNSRDQASWKP